MSGYSAFRARIMGPSLVALMGLGLMGAGSPALAQDTAPPVDAAPPAAQPDEIVVTGKVLRLSKAKIHRQARDISVVGNILHTPIARMETHLCPGIIGLQAEFAAQMIDRIRFQADRLDVPLAPDGCRANMIVVFTENGQEMLQSLYKKSPYMFKNITVPERRRLLADTGPVHVWSQVETRTRDGALVGRNNDLISPPTVSGWQAHSRIYLPVRMDITSVMIFVNTDVAGDKTLAQLADYSVMRGLVRTKPHPDMAMDSILSLFENEGPHPMSLTDFDQAYLNAIYDGIPNLRAAAKIGSINRELRKITESDE